MNDWLWPIVVLLLLGIFLVIVFFPKITEFARFMFRHPEWLYEQTVTPVTIANFRNSFNKSFSWKRVAIDIFDAAVSGKLILPEQLRTDDHEELRKRIKQLCRDHLNQILRTYEESFADKDKEKASYWKTYQQTKTGYNDFLRVADTLNKIPRECTTDFSERFCRTLYLLLTKERFHSFDNGTVQEYLARDCGFHEDNITAWCLMPKSRPGRKLPKDALGNT